jgi:hypothetical protein
MGKGGQIPVRLSVSQIAGKHRFKAALLSCYIDKKRQSLYNVFVKESLIYNEAHIQFL